MFLDLVDWCWSALRIIWFDLSGQAAKLHKRFARLFYHLIVRFTFMSDVP